MEKVVFGNAAPGTVVISTPNAEYNVVYERLDADLFRHDDHRFEWTRKEFSTWCSKVSADYGYEVQTFPVGEEEEGIGAPSQIALFKRR
jgi:hypothetical protein